jgi:hypothetical protein
LHRSYPMHTRGGSLHGIYCQKTVETYEKTEATLEAAGVAAGKDEVAETDALLFHAGEQTASPNEFGGEKPQTEQYHEPAGRGTEEQNYADSQKREAENDPEEALGLLKSPEKHCRDLFRSTNQLRGPQGKTV